MESPVADGNVSLASGTVHPNTEVDLNTEGSLVLDLDSYKEDKSDVATLPPPGASTTRSPVICQDTWAPKWAPGYTYACLMWSVNTVWGARKDGNTKLPKACRAPEPTTGQPWGLSHCAKTCGCEACHDSWNSEWAPHLGYACGKWSLDKEWGALKGGQTLHAACDANAFWGKRHCAKTCGCQQQACSDIWQPNWAPGYSYGCYKWSKNSKWGALKGKTTLLKACRQNDNWGIKNCAKTCGCQACVDMWVPDWAPGYTYACYKWSINMNWGALKNGATLQEACDLDDFWGRHFCAKSCGCQYPVIDDGDEVPLDLAASAKPGKADKGRKPEH